MGYFSFGVSESSKVHQETNYYVSIIMGGTFSQHDQKSLGSYIIGQKDPPERERKKNGIHVSVEM